ncbi:MAG: hypothetical protein RR662_03940 [Clostridia bacterium]
MEDKKENTMLVLAEQLVILREIKKATEDKVKEINAEIEETQKDLIEEMIENDIPNFGHNGKSFSLTNKSSYSAIPDKKAELYDVLMEEGYNDLFSVNAQTLNSFIKTEVENNGDEMPKFLEKLVSVYEKSGITIRKK